MSNGDVPQMNCALGICCALVKDRKRALSANLQHHLPERHPECLWTPAHCDAIADVVIDKLDEALPHLVPFMQNVAALANGPSFL